MLHLKKIFRGVGGVSIFFFRKTLLYHFISTFYAIFNIKENFERGGGGVEFFFFRKALLYHFISRFMLFSTLKKKLKY